VALSIRWIGNAGGGVCSQPGFLVETSIKTMGNVGFPIVPGLQFPVGVKECK
jgi:hypothetical protein